MARNEPAQWHRETARWLLAHERAAGTVEASPLTAPSRVYDRFHTYLAPLLGAAGVQSLFVRSAKLARGEFAPFAETSVLDGSHKLRERLQAHDPPLETESATTLFAIFLALLTTFIGERLTIQLLRTAWPTIDETGPRETKE